MKNILTILLVVTIFQTHAQSTKEPTNNELLEKISKLKIENEKFELRLNKELNETVYKLNEIQATANQTSKAVDDVESHLWSERFGVLAILSTIFGILLGYFGFRKLLQKKADEIFDKHLIKRFEEIKDGDIQHLYNEIESAGWKASIRSKNILVLNQKDTTLPEDFKIALKVFNPEYKDIATLDDGKNLDYSNYTLVVLENNEEVGYWDIIKEEEKLIELADKICGQETSFIYYSGQKGNFPNTNINKHLVNYSKSPSTLYNNVMNTLKFQDLLKNSKNNEKNS